MTELISGDPLGTVRQVAHGVGQRVKSAISGNDHQPLPTVPKVDLAKYAGLWYELARLPLIFQPDDTLSTAEYTLKEDGSVGVHNTNYKDGSKQHDIDGTATVAEGAEMSHARLKVQFGGIVKLNPAPAEGNYWVIELADDYSMALVGTPDRQSLWLLAREAHDFDAHRGEAYLHRAEELGFDMDKLLVDQWQTNKVLPYRITA